MAQHQLSIGIAQMHSIALTIAPHRTIGAIALTHPLSVTIFGKAILPHIPEIIFIDVSLMKICSDTRTSRDRAINKHRAYTHARITTEEMLTYIALIITQEALATIT